MYQSPCQTFMSVLFSLPSCLSKITFTIFQCKRYSVATGECLNILVFVVYILSLLMSQRETSKKSLFYMFFLRPKKYICVFTVTCQKKSRVGRSGLIFFIIIGKTVNSHSLFRNPIPVFHCRNFR